MLVKQVETDGALRLKKYTNFVQYHRSDRLRVLQHNLPVRLFPGIQSNVSRNSFPVKRRRCNVANVTNRGATSGYDR